MLTPWLIDTIYPMKITLCDTGTLILMTIVIIIYTYFYLPPKILTKFVGKILELCGENAT